MIESQQFEQKEKELEKLRHDLLQRLEVQSTADGIQSGSEIVNPDRADLAQLYVNRDRLIALREQMETTLAQVNAALERIQDGMYGKCTNCGRDILSERLEAIPYAEFCIICQKSEDRHLR